MDLTKTIELLEKSEHIGLCLAADPSFDSCAAAEVLARTLEGLGKKIGLLTESAAVKNIPFRTLGATSPLPKEFVISIDAARAPVAELRYEKSENGINIILSPKSSPIVKDALAFRDGKTLCDCVLAVGVPNIELLVNIPGLRPDFFTETPIVNIDASDQNGLYGEANLVDAGKASIAEIAYELLTALTDKPPDAELATLLLGGILFRTNSFRAPSTTPDALLAASELMRLGAKNKGALALLAPPESWGELQLTGRAFVRSRIDQSRGVLWSFITPEDFEKTSTQAKCVSKVLGRLEDTFPAHRLTVALWQDRVAGPVFASMAGERGALEEIATRAGGEFQSPHLKLATSYSSFREAESKIEALFLELF